MRLRSLLTALGTGLLVIASEPAGGPVHAARAVTQDRPLFSSESELVVLHVTVRDGKGRYVNGLSQDAFSILEDRRPQTIRLFSSEDAPVTVGLLIDSSGSMQSNRGLVIAAASAFVETSNPEDEIFALAFNEDVRAALPPTAPFTSDAGTLRDALTTAITARGRTALYDAVAGGLQYIMKGRYERKVLVVVSDGGDNASQDATFEQILTSTQASNAVIYAVGLIDPVEREADPKRLRRLAQASGGEAFFPRDARQVIDVLQNIARDIRNTYTIGYVPTSTERNGAFRRIGVAAHSAEGRPLGVRTRTGYLAGPATSGSETHAR